MPERLGGWKKLAAYFRGGGGARRARSPDQYTRAPLQGVVGRVLDRMRELAARNDAPALKQADCGTAVSGATDAARGAAAIILTAPGRADLAARRAAPTSAYCIEAFARGSA